MNKFRILTIDGGGLRGVVPLTILAELQRRRKKNDNDIVPEIWQSFDLIAGTSTGGLITCALTVKNETKIVAQYSINKIVNIYLDHGNDIFPQVSGLDKVIRDVKEIWHPTFSEKGIAKVFREVLVFNKISD